jgi:hypothetical protein
MILFSVTPLYYGVRSFTITFYYTIEPVKDSFRPRNLDMVDGQIRIKFMEVRDISRSEKDLIHLTFIKFFINSPAKYR